MSITNNVDLLNAVVERIKNIPAADIDGEIVMMHIEKGKYYGLDHVGSRIWELIEKPNIVNNIINTLMHEYDVDSLTCQGQVLEFINKLYNEELINVIDRNEGYKLL